MSRANRKRVFVLTVTLPDPIMERAKHHAAQKLIFDGDMPTVGIDLDYPNDMRLAFLFKADAERAVSPLRAVGCKTRPVVAGWLDESRDSLILEED